MRSLRGTEAGCHRRPQVSIVRTDTCSRDFQLKKRRVRCYGQFGPAFEMRGRLHQCRLTHIQRVCVNGKGLVSDQLPGEDSVLLRERAGELIVNSELRLERAQIDKLRERKDLPGGCLESGRRVCNPRAEPFRCPSVEHWCVCSRVEGQLHRFSVDSEADYDSLVRPLRECPSS